MGYPVNGGLAELRAAGRRVRTKSADQVFSVVALANVTDLDVELDANADYLITYYVWWDSTAITNGILLSVNGPAGPTKVGFVSWINSTGVTASAMQGAAYDGGASYAASKATADNFLVFTAVIRNGATAGTLQLRAASEAGGGPTVTIKAGSKVALERLDTMS